MRLLLAHPRIADDSLRGPVEESNGAGNVGKDRLVVPHPPQLSDLQQPSPSVFAARARLASPGCFV